MSIEKEGKKHTHTHTHTQTEKKHPRTVCMCWGCVCIGSHTHIYQSEIYVHTRVYPDVFMDFYVPRHSIHNCQNLEATKLSFCGD